MGVEDDGCQDHQRTPTRTSRLGARRDKPGHSNTLDLLIFAFSLQCHTTHLPRRRGSGLKSSPSSRDAGRTGVRPNS